MSICVHVKEYSKPVVNPRLKINHCLFAVYLPRQPTKTVPGAPSKIIFVVKIKKKIPTNI